MGILIAALAIEAGCRFYLFGFKLHYEDINIMDKTIFSKDKKYIFFVGDSFTKGYPFPTDQSYPMLLDGLIKNNKIKIVNFAKTGSNLYYQIDIIRQISALEPSLIVWGISTNDVCIPEKSKMDIHSLPDHIVDIDSEKPRFYSILKRAIFVLPYSCLIGAKMSIFSTIKEILANYSCAYIFLRSRLSNNRFFKFIKTEYNIRYELREISSAQIEYYKKDGINPYHVCDGASYIKDFLDNKKIGFVLLYVPQESDLNQQLFKNNIIQWDSNVSEYDRSRPKNFIKNFCFKNKIIFLDPFDAMEEEIRHDKTLFMQFDRHYNHFGNMFMAKFLHRVLFVAKYCRRGCDVT